MHWCVLKWNTAKLNKTPKGYTLILELLKYADNDSKLHLDLSVEKKKGLLIRHKWSAVNYSFAMRYRAIGKLLLALLICCPKMVKTNLFCVQIRIWEIGTKFTAKFLDVRSGDAVNKPILPFKQDQVDRYEWCNQQISIYCFNWYNFDSVFGQFLVYLTLSADCG